MTHQDAIDYIRWYLTKLHSNPDIYEDDTCNVITALEDFAIPALEMHIPKEVVMEREFQSLYGREYYACPYCGDFIRYRYSTGEPTYPGHCEFCGQALDWEK